MLKCSAMGPSPGNPMSWQRNAPAESVFRSGTGVANGTFGELLQGSLASDDGHFMVTLPVNRFSRAVFTPDGNIREITVTPAHKFKSRELILELRAQYGIESGGNLEIASELPEGKGMASSSADLVAVARAFESTFGCVIPGEMLLALLRRIEPSDGVMYPEFVTFFHRRVELRRRLGAPSRLKIVALDEGGRIDTIEYNHCNGHFTEGECSEYMQLLEAIEASVLTNDLARMGRVATRSAILNQKRNPKKNLDEVIEISHDHGALGVVIAHSGPCLGMLFPDDPVFEERMLRARARLANLGGNVFVVESLEAARTVPTTQSFIRKPRWSGHPVDGKRYSKNKQDWTE